jgi:hypothetical protein
MPNLKYSTTYNTMCRNNGTVLGTVPKATVLRTIPRVVPNGPLLHTILGTVAKSTVLRTVLIKAVLCTVPTDGILGIVPSMIIMGGSALTQYLVHSTNTSQY